MTWGQREKKWVGSLILNFSRNIKKKDPADGDLNERIPANTLIKVLEKGR